MSANQRQAPVMTEDQFKQRLLEFGLLSKITPPLTDKALRPVHEPERVSDNAVSERLIRERR